MAVVVWGGARFVRDTFRTTNDPTAHTGIAVVRQAPSEEAHAPRWRNFRMLLGAWKRGAFLLRAGFALIALGGYLINH